MASDAARIDGPAPDGAALGAAQLGQLRAIVRTLQAANAAGSGPSLGDVLRLASALHDQHGITVDFAATPDLGQPLVVVRLPAESSPTAPSDRLDRLTPREREIAALVAAGLSNKQIAARLHLTLGTVKHYVHQILDKTGLPGRVAIAIATAAQATTSTAGPPPTLG
jgi:DNA-binding NarL/FixJ family response regulator